MVIVGCTRVLRGAHVPIYLLIIISIQVMQGRDILVTSLNKLTTLGRNKLVTGKYAGNAWT